MPAMSAHQTRDRIVQTAEDIIRAEGVEKLTMRRLAEDADVALKTPYNVFGSKTGILIALLDRVTDALMADIAPRASGSALSDMLITLDRLSAFYQADEAYFRAIFWQIMTSDSAETRSAAHDALIDLVTARLTRAAEAGELRPEIDTKDLGNRLGQNLLANMGTWAGGHVDIAEMIDHTKVVWLALLRSAATDAARQHL